MTADHSPFPAPTFSDPPHVLIVAAPFYRAIADDLIACARATLEKAGATHETLEVPGALEIAPAIALAARSGRFEGFVALGCVIRGETTHYELVCGESARGVTDLTVGRGLAIGNGVLTVENEAQAVERARPTDRGGQDKGGGAAVACLTLIDIARRFGGAGGGSRPSSFRPASEQFDIAEGDAQ